MMKKIIKKEGVVKCGFCSNNISLKSDKFVFIGTYNREKGSDEELFFHFQCWVDYFNKCVIQKAKADMKKVQEKAISIFNNPMIKDMISQVKGSDMLFKMLQTPINPDRKINLVAKVSEKIEDDRRTKSTKRKRKSNKEKR